MVRDGGKKRYLTFVALKEVCTSLQVLLDTPLETVDNIMRELQIISRNAQLSASHQGTPLAPFANEVWELLFSNISDTKEEGTRNIIAECLGKLALSDPDRFIKSLQGKLKDSDDLVRATVVTAIRYTFTDEHGGDSYDNLLRPAISDFLQLVKDPSLVSAFVWCGVDSPKQQHIMYGIIGGSTCIIDHVKFGSTYQAVSNSRISDYAATALVFRNKCRCMCLWFST